MTGIPGSGISLLPHECISARLAANHVRNGKADDGYLYLTSQRLVHIPWPVAQRRGAVPLVIPLTEVTAADASPRSSNWRDGSWRPRLRITTSSGDAELFVVWRVNHAIGLVERARQEADAA